MLIKTGCNYSACEKRKRSHSPRKLAADISSVNVVDTKIMSKVIAARVG